MCRSHRHRLMAGMHWLLLRYGSRRHMMLLANGHLLGMHRRHVLLWGRHWRPELLLYEWYMRCWRSRRLGDILCTKSNTKSGLLLHGRHTSRGRWLFLG